ncbi:hypothetical protein DFJ63DRAFT_313695 [Scheffersomyces coipomensis]|uniref:uncharacterized protein n=1 Tax=Scheffersomyces coipomensis TaxID=1788519 RepID=UPI00315DD073
MTNWVAEIKNSLEVRDKFEKDDSAYHQAFMGLNDQLQLHQSFGVLQTSGNSNVIDDSQAMMSSIMSQNILKEDMRLKQENQELIDKLNGATFKSEKLESMLKEKQSDIRKQDKTIRKLNESIKNLQTEVREKDKLVNVANDEILARNVQLAVSKNDKYDAEQEILKLKAKIKNLETNNDYLEKNLKLVNERLSQVSSH